MAAATNAEPQLWPLPDRLVTADEALERFKGLAPSLGRLYDMARLDQVPT